MKKNKRKKKYSLPANYSVPKAVLDILLDLGDSITVFETPYQSYRRHYREFMGNPGLKNWRYKRAIQYLADRKHIRLIEKKSQQFLKLTKKGKLKALLNRLDADLENNQPWDGKWRLIIWDIPERERRYRNQLRNFIKDRGFYMLQQSVFVIPYPLPNSAVEFLKESGLLKYIRFLRVDKMDDDKFLRGHFGL